MKKIILINFMLLISVLTQAQNKNISIGIIGGADYYNYSFWGFPDSIKIDNYDKFEFPKGEHKFENKINYNVGLKAEYSVNNIIIGTNMLYSSKDYIVNYDIKPDTINGKEYPAYDKSLLRFRYLDVNINLGYTLLGKSKFNIVPQVGFTAGILLKADSKITFTDNTEIIYNKYTDAYVQHQAEKILFAVTGAVSFRYAISNNIKILFSPYFAQYINQLAELPMDRNPMAYGAKIGVIYNFNKQEKPNKL